MSLNEFFLSSFTIIYRLLLLNVCLSILQDLHTYVFCHPQSPDQFAIATNFPKRTLETESSDVQINTAGINNREVLYVYDLDA